MNAVFDIRLALSCLCRLFREVVASEFMGRPEPNTDFRIKIGSGKCHKKAEASTKTAFECKTQNNPTSIQANQGEYTKQIKVSNHKANQQSTTTRIMTKLWMNALQSIGEALDMHNLDREPGRIFITEVSSEVGQTIASRLIHTGYAQVRIGATITPTSFFDEALRGVEIVEFAWDREETYANALNGVKSVIITIPYKQRWYKYFSAFIKACKKAKVKHYVKLSFYLSHVAGTRQIPFVKHHANCDEMLISMIIPDEEHVTQMSYTIIAATHFMSNPIHRYRTKLSYGTDVTTSTTLWNVSSNHYATNYISPRDVAEAVTRVVLSPHKHYNRIYTILGPELVTNADLAALMSLYFGKQIKCIDCINMTDYRNKILETHSDCPLWCNKDQIALQQVMASGLEEHVANLLPNDFVRICGHSPELFLDYLTYRCSTATATTGGTIVFTKMVEEPMFGCGGGAVELFHV